MTGARTKVTLALAVAALAFGGLATQSAEAGHRGFRRSHARSYSRGYSRGFSRSWDCGRYSSYRTFRSCAPRRVYRSYDRGCRGFSFSIGIDRDRGHRHHRGYRRSFRW